MSAGSRGAYLKLLIHDGGGRSARQMRASVVTKELYLLQAQLCRVFSNSRRVQIAELLCNGERTVGDLFKCMAIGNASLSRQLAFMRSKGILATRRDGRHIYYRLAYPDMLKAFDLLRPVLVTRSRGEGTMARKFRQLAREHGHEAPRL
jgi:DNA-binding transcriptional ArsR family regulator